MPDLRIDSSSSQFSSNIGGTRPSVLKTLITILQSNLKSNRKISSCPPIHVILCHKMDRTRRRYNNNNNYVERRRRRKSKKSTKKTKDECGCGYLVLWYTDSSVVTRKKCFALEVYIEHQFFCFLLILYLLLHESSVYLLLLLLLHTLLLTSLLVAYT